MRFPDIFGDRVQVRYDGGKDRSESEGPHMAIVRTRLAETGRKISERSAMRAEFARAIGTCRHGTVADCRLIKTLTRRPHG